MRAVRPEELAPAVGTVLDEAELGQPFGLTELAPRSGRHGGHLFVSVDRKGMLAASDRLRFDAGPHRPAETAYVLARGPETTWR